jgi:energy-converting hydrogenase Eha subunit F
MNKFPKIVSKKWKRYNKLEKIFIIYLGLLLLLEFLLPVLKIE